MSNDQIGRSAVTIHTLWVYGELGPLEQLCLESWVHLGYKVVLHSYSKPRVPEGVELFSAANLIPENQVFRATRLNSLAIFSDIYRITIMKHFDALWLDADIFLIRYFDFSARNILAYEETASIGSINNAVLKLEANHPIVEEIIDRFKNPIRAVPWKPLHKAWPFFRRSLLTCSWHAKNLPWGALGRLAIGDVIKKDGFDGQILAPEYCLTGSAVRIFDTVDEPEKYVASPLVYVHFYKSQLQIDLSRPAPGSIYEMLWKRLGRD